MISADRIPNNVDLHLNKRLQRALEHWQPQYLQWWRDMGPQGFQDYHQVYVRTAVSVDPSGWAHFEYVKLPDYRWGIFLAEPEHDRRIGFGQFKGQAAWQNWIFQRPNAVGPKGALTAYGTSDRAEFDYGRV